MTEHLTWDRVPEPVIGCLWASLVAWRMGDLAGTIRWLGRAIDACPTLPEPVHHAWAAGRMRDEPALRDEMEWIAEAIDDTPAAALDYDETLEEVHACNLVGELIDHLSRRYSVPKETLWPLCWATVRRVQKRLENADR